MLKISENSKCLRLHDSVKMLKYNKELPIKRFKEEITMIRFEIHGDNLTITNAIRNDIQKIGSFNVILMTYQMQWRMLKLKLIQFSY